MNEDEAAVVCYQDEVHFQVQSTITRQWYPKGSTPKVQSRPGRQSIAYSGFVIPEDGTLCVTKPSWFNYETVIGSIREFLATYTVPEGKQLYIVMDNAPWHKKAKRLIEDETSSEYADIREKVILILLTSLFPRS